MGRTVQKRLIVCSRNGCSCESINDTNTRTNTHRVTDKSKRTRHVIKEGGMAGFNG